jgi:phosphomannomutase
VGPHHYKRLDIEFHKNRRKDIEKCMSDMSYKSLAGMKIINLDFSQGLRITFEKNQWLVIRFSGTEPLLRIYAEAESVEKVDQLLSDAQAIVGI